MDKTERQEKRGEEATGGDLAWDDAEGAASEGQDWFFSEWDQVRLEDAIGYVEDLASHVGFRIFLLALRQLTDVQVDALLTERSAKEVRIMQGSIKTLREVSVYQKRVLAALKMRLSAVKEQSQRPEEPEKFEPGEPLNDMGL